MFLIETSDGLRISHNKPSDDIVDGLINHWGDNIRVVRLTTNQEFVAAESALKEGGSMELDGLSIVLKDAAAVTIATYTGVQIYPAP